MIAINTKGIKKITGASQRLISNETLGFIALIEGTKKSKTWTKQDVEEFTKREMAITRITEKKWDVPDELKEIKAIKAINVVKS